MSALVGVAHEALLVFGRMFALMGAVYTLAYWSGRVWLRWFDRG